MAIQFDKYYTQPWPYEWELGVGLELSGYPDNVAAFIDLMQSESCNPVATRRILEDLKQYGIKRTTVMASLNFNRIGDSLANMGVVMKIIIPASAINLELNRSEFDKEALDLIKTKGKETTDNLNKYNEEEKHEILQRYRLAQKSMDEIPYNLGLYA